jgi:hypothetical protein
VNTFDFEAQMSLRVPFDELEQEDGHWIYAMISYRGAPFTGIAIETKGEVTTELPFVNGDCEGYCASKRAGILVAEFHMSKGQFIKESKKWDSTGTALLQHQGHEKPRFLRLWNNAGQLIESHDEANNTRLYFAENGVCRKEQRGHVVTHYSEQGELIGVLTVKTNEGQYLNTYQFEQAILKAQFETLVLDFHLENIVYAWVGSLIEASRNEALTVLARLLVHEDLWVKKTAIQIVGNAKLAELKSLIEANLGDERIPPRVVGLHGGKSATMSIGYWAKRVLSQLSET